MPGITDELDPELVSLLIDGARYGDMEDVDAALAQSLPVDAKDGMGRTALHMACANGHTEVITRLLGAGALPDLQNDQGNTPLHWACLNGHKEAVRLLMDKGASAAVLNEAGRTPVDEALGRDYKGVSKSGDYIVQELDESGRKAGTTGPNPNVPRGLNWHKQTSDSAMHADSPLHAPPGATPGGPMDRRAPGGPVGEALDPLRPTDDSRAAHNDPATHVIQRVKQAAASAWDTLKHGVNNAGQPQIVEELRRTEPESVKAVDAQSREGGADKTSRNSGQQGRQDSGRGM